MAYQVLARKWRPNRFAELVGQEHVVTAISNALDNNRLHHAYLFTGTRGVGKTTIARIFSKSLNCESGMSATPCGECHTCQEIENGSFVDLLEIDAASRTKVEDTRELLDNVQYKPTRGQFKVYLIDEVHMLSKHSFNALLKTLEEPPPHVKFLLATTDPQKLPVTILSRCLQFNLKALSREQITSQLNHVLSEEEISFEPNAIAQLARAAQGSMRDALSLTDQAIAQGNGNVSNDVVTSMLGLMDKTQVIKLVHSVLNSQADNVMQQVESLAQQAVDFEQVLNEIMSTLHQIALTQLVPEACKLETVSAKALYHLAKSVSAEHVQLCYQIALQGKKDIGYAADPRTGIEMTLLRMLAFTPDNFAVNPTQMKDLGQRTLGEQREQDVRSETAKPTVSQDTDEEDIRSLPEMELDHQQQDIIAQAEQLGASSNKPNDAQYSVENPARGEHTEHSILVNQETSQAKSEIEHSDYDPSKNNDESTVNQQSPENAHSVDLSEYHASNQQELEQVSATQSLIDLKNKLSGKNVASEVADPNTKKSEDRPSVSSLRSAQQTSESAENSSTQATPFKPEKNLDNDRNAESTINDLDAVDYSDANSNDRHDAEIQHSQQIEKHQSQSEQVKQSTPTDGSLSPPWVASVSTAPPVDENDKGQPENKGEQNRPAQPVKSDFEPAFDPQAHLDEPIEVEVDFDVPVFMLDGEKIIASEQLDTWSQLIEKMQLTALTKQLALHSSYHKNDQQVTLKLINSKPHLDTESARNQLQQALTELFEQNIELNVELGTPINTPFAVQQTINKVRLDHAKQVAENDEDIQRIKNLFDAHVVTDSIKPR